LFGGRIKLQSSVEMRRFIVWAIIFFSLFFEKVLEGAWKNGIQQYTLTHPINLQHESRMQKKE
jgi:hypothetical protein